MKKVYIIHGWGGSPDEPMLKWVREQLQNKGYEVIAPVMPHPDTPTIEDWVSFLDATVKNPGEEVYLIGHSVGCQTVLRYLETLPLEIKVGGVILIAPWIIFPKESIDGDEDPEIAKAWLETPIDYEKIATHTNNFVGIFSDNDPFVPLLENETLLKEKLNAKTIVLHNKGHFTGEDNVTELPEVLEILK